MGSPEDEVGRNSDETQHQVALSFFRMSKYTITNAQYAAFLNAKNIGSDGVYAAGAYPTQVLIYASSGSYDWGLHYSGSQWVPAAGYKNNPVIDVTWYGATEFATYVGGTLPTEAQWEYACRAGTTTPFNTGNFLTNLQANYNWERPYIGGTNTVTTFHGTTQPVGTYTPNAYGLYDMHGNVWEWCADWDGTYSTTAQTNPTGVVTGSYRVYRGGSYVAQSCRSAIRSSNNPDGGYITVGFRVVFNNELTKTAIYSDSVTDIDGNVYKTVQIGNQVWMAENLRVSRYQNGDLIPNVKVDDEWKDLEKGACCNYNNNPIYDVKYGKLYNGYAIKDLRNIAPTGWHVATDTEWNILANYISTLHGVSDSVEKACAANSDREIALYAGSICNDSYLRALLGGYRWCIGIFDRLDSGGYWWCDTEDRFSTLSYRSLNDYDSNVYNYGWGESEGFSVRCIKNIEKTETKPVIDIDGNIYKTVQIGNQVWMAENLRVSRYRNGELIPNIQSDIEWKNLKTGACCNYDNNPEYDVKYGKLYNWFAVDDKRGLAPEGWHMTNDDEWETLEKYVSTHLCNSGTSAKAIATTTDWGLSSNSQCIGNYLYINNSSGFSALPCGCRKYNDGAFENLGYYGNWWSATEHDSRYSRALTLINFVGGGLGLQNDEKSHGYSVRCVRDY